MKLDIVIFGLSITSSWGNGHATTYRALLKALADARPPDHLPRARRAVVSRESRPAEPTTAASSSIDALRELPRLRDAGRERRPGHPRLLRAGRRASATGSRDARAA